MSSVSQSTREGACLLAVAAVIAFAVSGCSRQGKRDGSATSEAPVWFTHCEGPEFRDVTVDPNYGSGPPGEIVKINERLVLVPPARMSPTYFGENPKSKVCRSKKDLTPVTFAAEL
jgi:hypothetical protein